MGKKTKNINAMMLHQLQKEVYGGYPSFLKERRSASSPYFSSALDALVEGKENPSEAKIITDSIMKKLKHIKETLTVRVNAFETMARENKDFKDAFESKAFRGAIFAHYAGRFYVSYLFANRSVTVDGESCVACTISDDDLPDKLVDCLDNYFDEPLITPITDKRYGAPTGNIEVDNFAEYVTSVFLKEKKAEQLNALITMVRTSTLAWIDTLISGRVHSFLMPYVPADLDTNVEAARNFIAIFQSKPSTSLDGVRYSAMYTVDQLREFDDDTVISNNMESLAYSMIGDIPRGRLATTPNGLISDVSDLTGYESYGIDYSCLFPQEDVKQWDNIEKFFKNGTVGEVLQKGKYSDLAIKNAAQVQAICAFHESLACERIVSQKYDRLHALYAEQLADHAEQLANAKKEAPVADTGALDEALATANARIAELEQQLKESEDKRKAAAERAKTLQAKLDASEANHQKTKTSAESEAEKLRSTIDTLNQQVEDMKSKLEPEAEPEPEPEKPVTASDLADLDFDVFNRIPHPVILGGHDNFISAMQEVGGNVRIYSRSIPDDALQNATVIWMQLRNLSHSMYYKAKDTARIRNIPIFYFNSTSTNACKKQMVEEALEFEKSIN